MKKTILGSSMLISGVIGFSLTIHANATQRANFSRIWGGMSLDEWIFALAFLALAVAGFYLAWQSVKDDK